MAQSIEEKLVGVLRSEEQEAQGWQESELTSVREDSLNYYDREPMGDEVDGQSKIVTSEYADTVESIMPAMMRAFTSSEKVVEFLPDQPEDEQWAKEASSYIPHLIMRENEGYRWFYWFLKDLLMYRLSWGCVDIEEVEKTKTAPINAMPADAWAVTQQQLTEAAAQTKAEMQIEVEAAEDGTVSGKVTTTRKVKQVVIDNIAPEDGLVTPMARTIDEASFVGYRKRTTASELRILGVDQDTIDNLSSDNQFTVEQGQRQPDVIQATSGRNTRNDSERTLWLVLAYVKFDKNEDGISETLRVLYAHAGGSATEIIEEEEWTDGIAPIVPGSPILMSHTIPGRSLFDQVRDIQEISTAITRGMLDNMYLVNRPRPVVSDAIDLASLLDWTPGMPIRRLQGRQADPNDLVWSTVTPVMDKALAVLQWKDAVQQKRTGVTPNNQGQTDEAMNPTATGVSLLTSAADERINLIVRTIAETSIKRLYRLIYRAVKRAAIGPTKYYAEGSWVGCDPSRWPDDMKLEAVIGGVSNKQQQLTNLGVVAQAQEKLVALQGGPDGPLVTMEQAANTGRKIVEAAGLKGVDQYINAPPKIAEAKQIKAQQPPPPTPEMMKVQADAQAAQAKQQSDAQMKQQQMVMDNEHAQQKLQSDIALSQQKNAADLQAKREAAALDLQLQREKAAQDMQLAREKAAMEMELKRQELQLEAELKAAQIAAQPSTPPTIQQQDTV